MSDEKPRIDITESPEMNLELIREELIREPKQFAPEVQKIGNGVYRNGALIHITRDNNGEPVLAPHTKASMAELLSQRLAFFRPTRNGATDVEPPAALVAKLIETPAATHVPVVEQIVNAPVFGPHGELHTEPGLLRDARAWYEPTDAMVLSWPVPDEPTDEHVGIAMTWINELFHDFPFESGADRAHAWGLLLLPFVRPMIDGPTPLHSVEAPTRATGKSKLTEAALLPALGYRVAAHPEPESGAEWRKNIMSFLVGGKPVFFLDNLNGKLDSGVLSSALTQRTLEDRILGHSRQVTVDVRCIWVVTANKPRYSEEIARRCVRILIDSHMKDPQLRTGFRHDDLLEWAREHRGQLVWSALTIVRAWLARGRPGPPSSVPRLGSYESWREVIGGILTVAGHGDAFLSNYHELLDDHREVENEDVCIAVDAWWDRFGDTPVAAKDLAEATVSVTENAPPLSIGALLVGADDGELTGRAGATRLGTRLRELESQVICDRRIAKLPIKTGNRKYYRLEPVG